jgi:hypothetical protein
VGRRGVDDLLIRGPRSTLTESRKSSSDLTIYYPSTLPTYLPSVAPGATVPEREMEKWAEREDANQTEPGYSSLTWSNGDVTNPGTTRDIGSVALCGPQRALCRTGG